MQGVQDRLSLHFIAFIAKHYEKYMPLILGRLNFFAFKDASTYIPDIIGFELLIKGFWLPVVCCL